MKKLLFPALLLAAFAASAGKGPRYSYGEAWWREYHSDAGTHLLLHFGPPTQSGNEKVKQHLEKKKQDENLFELDEINAMGDDGLGVDGIDALAPGKKPLDDENVPADVALDYSDNRARFKLPEGMRKVPGAGRFGGGLVCSGQAGWKVRVPGGIAAVECSFKVDRLPQETVCLFSVDGDVGKLLLHPDGRLEIALAKPHGEPWESSNSKRSLTEIEKQLVNKKDSSIVSPPVETGQWHHVAIWNKPHPTPGGGEPWDARLTLNGTDVDFYLSERNNVNKWLGGRTPTVVVGDSHAGGSAFSGVIDEFRVSSRPRVYYERPDMPWRDMSLSRPLQFDRPAFRQDSTVFHASLDKGRKYDRGDGVIELELKGAKLENLQTEGVRGQGWVIDPRVGFPRFSMEGMNAEHGSLEFWLRPVNWDDVTGYWQHSPPKNMHLSVARFYGRDRNSGKTVRYLNLRLPRAHNIERARLPLDPGHWGHYLFKWGRKGGRLYHHGKVVAGAKLARGVDLQNMEPSYVEFGVNDDVTVVDRSVPLIEIDEVVGYSTPLGDGEIAQAEARWKGKLQPIPLYRDKLDFKWSLQKLTYEVEPKLPEDKTPALCRIKCEPLGEEVELQLDKGKFSTVLNDGTELPQGDYEISFAMLDAHGKVLTSGKREWTYEEEEWRHCRAGILDETPAPWTSIKIDDKTRTLVTRMTRYELGDDGLPSAIHADGTNILAGPIRFFEDSAPIKGQLNAAPASADVDADWQSTFKGQNLDVAVDFHAEYDGMIKFTVRPRSTGQPSTLRMVIPIKGKHASHALYYPMGARGVSNTFLPEKDGTLLSSRAVFKDNYGFFGHLDINDMTRGLWWFCDNAAGWVQTKDVPAIAIERQGDVVNLVLNLVAEPVEYAEERPIVFAILPHPARPMPEEYRLYNRVSPETNNRASNIFDAFRPWPMAPRSHGMKMYPAPDPENPDDGPSWEYAEKCIPHMKSAMPTGVRTMYLSKAWFSCRAGAYDHWEWRSGASKEVSLTPTFVNYLCWEMDQWIGRGIWEAIYLDECYEHAARNLAAGMSVRLPDGTEQPGVTNFQFRELMKRWRGIFHQHGLEPIVIAHHTYSWQYHGLVFCDAYLDGENRPIVSLRSRDWIDSTGKAAFENVQNGELWGMASFYMPFIAEGGFHEKERSQFPKWQWRMARQAQSEFAHYEVATVYEGQGSQVYKAYWNDLLGWGVGDPNQVEFYPYWRNDRFVHVVDPGKHTYVSFYRKPNGDILLIASNHEKKQRTLKITLNLDELGLKQPLNLAVLDSSFNPPHGDDYRKSDAAKTPKVELSIEDDPGEELALDGPREIAAKKAAALAPKLDGNILALPVRARDYRVVTVEQK